MRMKKFVLVFGLVVILYLGVGFVSGEQVTAPTQQTNKILLSPFYRETMTQNLNYSYTLIVNPPDKVSQVQSAILTFDAYINPARTFWVWVNGVPCNNPSYTVSTTYAGAGKSQTYFDCSNRITKEGTYNITIRVTGGNIGASTSWVDITYSNRPSGSLTIHGTEYLTGQQAKVWLQLVDNSGQYIDDGICYLHIYTPSNENYLDEGQMSNLNERGVYYYDLITPFEQGVYPAIANCFYTATETKIYPSAISINKGTAVFTNLDSAFTIDGNYFRYNEATPNPRQVSLNWTFPASNFSECLLTPEVLMTGLNVYFYGTFDSVVNDDITIEIYNWTSNSWTTLPNKITEGSGYKSVSNFISTNNITKSGYYSATNGIRVRTSDTALTDTTNNPFDVDQVYIGCDELADPQWQDVKGSSELHVTSDKLYEIQFDSFSFSPEKINYYNITVGSQTSVTVEDSLIDIPIYYAYICGAIESVTANINGTMVEVNWTYSKARETILDSCNVIVTQDLEANANYEYSIKFKDKWQEYSEARLSRVNYLDEYIRAGCEFYRQSFGYPNYTVPIGISPNSSYGYQYSVCEYYVDSYYQLNKSVTEKIINKFSTTPVIYTEESLVKEIEADVLEIASLTEQIVIIADSIIQEWNTADAYSTTILGNTNVTPEVIQYWSQLSSSWANYNRNVSVELGNVTVDVNSTEIADSVWNYGGTINSNIVSQITLSVWSYSGLITSSILNQFANATWLWSSRNLTYYPPMNVTTQVINLTTQNVTVQNITVNVTTQIVQVQNYTVNVTTQIVQVQNVTVNVTTQVINLTTQNVTVQNVTINNSDIANAVWTYTPDRNLTYYQNFGDQTNYTLIEQLINVSNTQPINYTLIGELVTLYGNNNTDLTNYTLIGELINATKTEPINYTLIENLIKQYQNNLTSEDVWTYSDRQLTAFNFTVNTTINLNNINSTDIAQAIWNYGGPVNSNIIQQFGDYTVCMIESILNPDEGWGVQIRQC